MNRGYPQYVKMETFDDMTWQSIQGFTKRHIKEGARIKSDNYR
jgi:hypothetical protein